MRTIRWWLVPALFVLASACFGGSGSLVAPIEGGDDDEHGEDLCRTQGYWKNHEEAWPVTTLSLGARQYTQAELLLIFDESVGGNGLISLAHQLIAAKLNIAAGASDDDIADEIAAADALIGALVVPPIGDGYLHPSVTSDLNDALTFFNESDCEAEMGFCGDGELDDGEECDDGNTMDGDGCSAECEIEEDGGFCGDGELDDGEECDDGNTTDGDGCSANCTIEEGGPECGNGILETGEQCDDGNTDDHDGCTNDCRVVTI